MKDWENLRYFLAVARNGTVSAAASALGVSHSTVLRRIEQFEVGLNAKLFKKLQSGYELTSAGENLFHDAKDIEHAINAVFTRAEGNNDPAAGKLRISQPENGAFSIYPLYAEFARKYPDITLEVHSTMQQHNLNQQEVDVAFRVLDEPPDLLVGRCLGKIKARAYASKQYLKRLPKERSPSDYDWILWNFSADGPARKYLHKNVKEPKVVLYAETIPDVVSAVRHGMGVGFLSSHEASQYKDLVALLDGKVVAEYDLWMLTHRDLRNSTRVKTFMRFIAENLTL